MIFDYSLADKQRAKCPLCDGTTFTRLASVDRYGMGVCTVACNVCGFITTDPVLSGPDLDKFYREQYRSVYSKVDFPSHRYILKNGIDRRAEYIANFVVEKADFPFAARVLDVGCAEGSVLRAIRHLRPNWVTLGVEPGAFGEFAKGHAGCDVVPSLEQTPLRTYDLVLLNHVLEHAQDPLALLRDLRDRLAPSGKLFVDVPDAVAYSTIDDLHVAHVHHFTPTSLRRLGARAGLRCILLEQHRPPRHPRSVRCLFEQLEGVEEVDNLEPNVDDREAACGIRAIGSDGVLPTLRRWAPARKMRGLLQKAVDVVVS